MMEHRLRVFVASVVVLLVGVAVWLLIPPEPRPAYPPTAGALSASEAQAMVFQASTAKSLNQLMP